MAARLELLKEQFFDDSGNVLSGGYLYTYVVGTTTEKATYTTVLGNVEQANPVVLDSSGRVATDLYGVGAYKIVIKDSDGNTIDTIPSVSGINSNAMTAIGDYSGDLDAAITAISSTETTLVIDDTATMSANTTVPVTCKIKVEKGGTINQSTYTLTLNGPIEAGPYQVFTGTGTVNINEGGDIWADWFGSGKNDTTLTAMQSMLGSSNTHTIKFSPQTWSITDDFTLTDNFVLDIPYGCLLSITSAKTLTLPTRPIAGEYQIFTGSGTVSFTDSAGHTIFPQWWYSGSGYWTTAIQAAIDSVSTDGGEAVLPPRDYEIDDTLLMRYQGLLFRGLGGTGNSHVANTETNRGATIINKSGDSDGIIIGLDDTYVSDIVLKDFALDGDSGTATAGNGIILGTDTATGGVSQCKLENVSIHHADDYGLYLNGNVFENAFVNVSLRFNEEGIALGGSNGSCTQNSFHGVHSSKNTNYGVKDTGATFANSFHGCYFGENDYGVDAVWGTTLYGCYAEDNTTTGIIVTGYNVLISGGFVTGSVTGVDFSSSAASNSTIIGTYFNDNTTDISVFNGCRNTVIQNVGGAAGVQPTITNSDRTTLFIDNNFETLTEAGAAKTYGITEFNSTGGAMAVTLALGTAIGQRKMFKFDTDGGDVTLTVANHETSSPEVFTFDTAGSYLILESTGSVWVTVKNYGVTA